MSDLAKQYEAPRLAAYLKRSLQHLGTPIWQEIPDDPKGASPYVHFEHPVGQIIVAPVDTDQGTIWQFTPDTLKKIRALYAAIDDMPPQDMITTATVPGSVYFSIRDEVSDSHPVLVTMLGPMEVWQWLGLSLALTLAYVIGRLVSAWIGRPLLRRFKKNLADHPFYQLFLIWSLRLLFMGVTLRLVDEPLGLPEVVELLVLTISWSAIILSVAILFLLVINLIANRMITLRSIAGHNITLVSLVAGVARVLVTVAAVLLLADVLKIPYQGVLAGLGIGGLAVALAAQSTLQNFISGITLYFDKPIAVGDYCRFGNKEGTVEFIGMRSTRIRTLDRTLVTVPNSEFSNMQIENYAKRDRMFLNTLLELRYETTPDQLRFLLAEVRTLLGAHPKVAEEPLRVRFIGFGDSSLDIEIFAYVLTNQKPEFLAIREEILLSILTLIENAGTQLAYTSMVSYLATDTPNDPEKTRAAEAAVARWRENDTRTLP
ncbi:MAG: mechanosensitive ion channel family protein [Pusillimonas sp.]